MKTERKSYKQYCPMATALDVIGDRWTMLIIRELLGGSARFNEIRDGLPGIAGNLLTERLRRLEEDGIIEQRKIQNTPIYTLTKIGLDTRIVLEELAMWGTRVQRVAPAEHDRSLRAAAMALQSILVRAGDALPEERLIIELEVDGEFAEIVLDQNPTVTVRPSLGPDARVQTSTSGIASVLSGRFDDSTLSHISGDESATQYLVNALR